MWTRQAKRSASNRNDSQNNFCQWEALVLSCLTLHITLGIEGVEKNMKEMWQLHGHKHQTIQHWILHCPWAGGIDSMDKTIQGESLSEQIMPLNKSFQDLLTPELVLHGLMLSGFSQWLNSGFSMDQPRTQKCSRSAITEVKWIEMLSNKVFLVLYAGHAVTKCSAFKHCSEKYLNLLIDLNEQLSRERRMEFPVMSSRHQSTSSSKNFHLSEHR